MNKILFVYKNMSKQMKASIWFIVCSFMQKGISEITTPIFTRILSTNEYGQYNVFNTWLNFITVIVVFKLSAGVYTQGLIKYEEDRDKYVSSMHGLSLTLCTLWTFIYCAFRSFWNSLLELSTVQMLAMLVMIWATTCFNLWATKQRVLLEYKKLVILTAIVSVAKPVVGVIFVLMAEDKVTARILGLMLVELFGYAFLSVLEIRKGRCFFSKQYWKITILLCVPLIPHYLCQTALNSADRIMIKKMIGDSEAGIYSLAYSVSQIMTLFNAALVQTISPWIGRKIKDKEVHEIPAVVNQTILLVAALNILIVLIAPELISIAGPQSYYQAIWIMPPVALAVIFNYSYSVFAAFEFYFEKTKLMSVATTFGALLNIVLNYIFIQLYGYYAAGYTTLFCFLFYAMFHFMLMKKIVRREFPGLKVFDTKQWLLFSCVIIIVGLALMMTYNYIVIRYGLIVIALIAAIYFRRHIIAYIKKIVGIRKKA